MSTTPQLPNFSVIVAATHSGGIGINGDMPWGQSLKQDLARFKQITTSTTPSKRHAVIMGRHTWNSIPSKFRPLPNRLNVVLTTQEQMAQEIKSCVPTANHDSILTSSSLTSALTTLSSHSDVDHIYVIGGAHVYNEALNMSQCQTIHQTLVLKEFTCDTYFPQIDRKLYHVTNVGDILIDNSIPYQFITYQRDSKSSISSTTLSEQQQKTLHDDVKHVNHEELAYLNLVRNVIEHGVHKGDRTGTGTISLFGTSLRFSLRDGVFPLLTTKTVFWRGVVEELLWLVRGCTDSKILTAKKVHIWDGNGSRSFLDNLGFTQREEGDLGPVYGFQWRHFGAEYVDCRTDYTGQGVDQLQQIIDTIKKNPNDRRILMSAWNPSDLNKMALPPCHVMCQFYVANGELSCQMYQRSCDLGLGVPFNIASYSLLTYMIAHMTGLKPGEFVHCMGDTHVYSNHVEPLLEQLRRTPGSFPKLSITRDVSSMKSIDDFQFEDFKLEGYTPQGSIKMQMAV